MAPSDDQQAEIVQPEADEKWIFLQDGGDSVKEQLLEEQDGDVIGDKQSVQPELSAHDTEKLLRWCRSGTHDTSGLTENIRNAAERLHSTQNTQKLFWWWHSAWNDAFVHKTLWEDKRLYVLCAALFVHTVLHVLAAVASLMELNALEALLITLEHFTKATLSAAVFSIATRFTSVTAVKATLQDKSWSGNISEFLFMTNTVILLVACYACTREVGAGITVFQEARREENVEWFLLLLADFVMVYGLTAAIAMSASLVVLMGNDVKVTSRAQFLHIRMKIEYRKLVASGRLKGRAYQDQSLEVMIVIFVATICAAILIPMLVLAIPLLQQAVASRKRDTTLAL